MITFKRTDGEIVQPQPCPVRGAVAKKGDCGGKPEVKAEEAEDYRMPM